MAQSLAKLLVHLVFSTKHRARLLPHEPYEELRAFCAGVLKNHKCHLVAMNNVEDHVHVLFELHRTAALSDIVMHLKTSSSKLCRIRTSSAGSWMPTRSSTTNVTFGADPAASRTPAGCSARARP